MWMMKRDRERDGTKNYYYWFCDAKNKLIVFKLNLEEMMSYT